MNNNEVLGHLLKIESEAAALVNDAQAEADRRVAEAEKQNRAAYEERYRTESAKQENEFQKIKEDLRRQYQQELENYREKISAVNIDTDRFSSLLDRFIAEEM